MQRVPLPSAVATIYKAVEELEKEYKEYNRKFTPDGHLVGSIGEVIAAIAFGLKLHRSSHPGHDAEDQDGRQVQIKLTSTNAVSMYGESDRLIVLQIVSPEEAEVVFDGDGKAAWHAAGKKQKNGQRSISFHRLRQLVYSSGGKSAE